MVSSNCVYLLFSLFVSPSLSLSLCLSSCKLQRCSRCKVKFYCSKTCQSEDWSSGHKLGECAVYAKDLSKFNGRLINLDTPRLLLRLSLLLTKRPDQGIKAKGTNLNDGSPRSYNSLMDHKENLLKDKNRIEIYEEMVYLFTTLDIFMDPDLILSGFGRLLINGFTILDPTFTEIGYGLFIGASQFDHSCKPNGVPVFDGTNLQIRAMTDIDTSTEPLLITYLDITMSTQKRKETLTNKYYFNCACDRCLHGPNIEPDFETKLTHFIELTKERQWKTADELGRQLLPIFEQYFQYYHPELTVHLMQLLQIRRNMGTKVYHSSDTITNDINGKLRTSILITHGPDHSLFKNDYIDLLNDLQ